MISFFPIFGKFSVVVRVSRYVHSSKYVRKCGEQTLANKAMRLHHFNLN